MSLFQKGLGISRGDALFDLRFLKGRGNEEGGCVLW